jgi:uncharacterized membrane protein (DUF485 family)
MDALNVSRIRNSPKFQELERKRNSLSWTLSILMIVIYAAFVLLAALDPAFLAQPLGDGVITLAFPLGLGVMVVAVVLTGFYVARANTEFDRLTREIVGEAENPVVPVGAGLVGGVR